jgi:hypothetical protein
MSRLLPASFPADDELRQKDFRVSFSSDDFLPSAPVDLASACLKVDF